MISIMKNSSTKANFMWPKNAAKDGDNHQLLTNFLLLLKSAATNIGEEFSKLGEAAKNGFAHRRILHPPQNMLASSHPEEESIIFQDTSQGHLLLEPEFLLFPTQRQDVQIFPTLQLLEPQKVTVLEPLEAVLAVFRQELVDHKTNTKLPQPPQIKVAPKRIIRPLQRLVSTEEIKRRKAIERKLSLIRKGRFAVPNHNNTPNVNVMMRTQMLLAAAC